MEDIIKAPEGYKFEKLDDNTIKLVIDKRLYLLNQLNGKDWFYIKYLDIHGLTIELLTNNSNLFKLNNIGYRWFFNDKNAIHKNNKSILRLKREENKYDEYILSSNTIDFSPEIKQIIEVRLARDAEIKEMYFHHPKLKPTFPNKESEELIKEKMLLMQEMYAFAHAMNDGWLPNWNDNKQIKWGLHIYANKIAVEWYWLSNNPVFGVAVKSKEIAEQMLEEFGERIEKYYDKQY